MTPALKFASSRDLTGIIPGLRCVALEKPLPGSSINGWFQWWKIARLIEAWPF